MSHPTPDSMRPSTTRALPQPLHSSTGLGNGNQSVSHLWQCISPSLAHSFLSSIPRLYIKNWRTTNPISTHKEWNLPYLPELNHCNSQTGQDRQTSCKFSNWHLEVLSQHRPRTTHAFVGLTPFMFHVLPSSIIQKRQQWFVSFENTIPGPNLELLTCSGFAQQRTKHLSVDLSWCCFL